jgi:ADP-ribose pyrophosphatase YjhB (NUDIX family)
LRHVVVNALIIKDNKLLLTKRSPKITEGNKWSLVGGFVDRDETLEAAIKREIFEETGYRTIETKLFMVLDKPDRRNEDRQNVAFAYVCKVGEKEGKPDWESIAEEWFDFDSLPKEEEMAFDHLEVIQIYLKNKDFATPLFRSR